MRRTAIGLLACTLGVAGMLRMGAQAPDKKPPTVRVSTRLVQVSIVVLDKDGKPVTGLTRDDFEVLDGGQPQSIALFSSFSARVAASPAEPLPANTFTNRGEHRGSLPTTVTVILFDALNTPARDLMYSRNQVVHFLQKLRPEDRIGLFVLSSRGLKLVHDIARDTDSLVRQVRAYRQRQETLSIPATAETTGVEQVDEVFAALLQRREDFQIKNRARDTLEALVGIANYLAQVPGRKNLVWVSASFPITFGFDSVSTLGQRPKTPSKDPDLGISRERGAFLPELERAARALNQASLTVYPVDARGLMTDFPWSARGQFDVMRMLAQRTGGRAFYNTNDVQGAVREAVDESRVTYELAYYPTHGKWDGRFRPIKVRVKRPGMEVRHRGGYFALGDPVSDPKQQAALLDADARSPLESTALGLTVRLEPVPEKADTWNVRIEMDARQVGLEQKDNRWFGTLTLAFVQRRANGTLAARNGESLDLKLVPATYERLVREGVRLSKRIQILPEAAELRIVVRDVNSGTVGSVYIPIAKLSSANPN